MTINQRIKDLIKSKGMTQKAFAGSIGMAPESLSRILAGGKVSENVITAIVKLYNVNREWLETGSDELFNSTNKPNPPEMITNELKKHQTEIDDIKSRLRIIGRDMEHMYDMLNVITETVNRLSEMVEKKRTSA